MGRRTATRCGNGSARIPSGTRVLHEEEDTRPYECDGLTAYRQLPMVVALPETNEQVQRILKTCSSMKVPVVPRGAGTGLSGGALPPGDGVLLSLAKFMRMLRVDPLARIAVVQPGVRNAVISEVAAPFGLYYAPDPVEPDRLHDRRQRRGELRRRALPEVRPHACTTCCGVRGFTIDGEPIELGGEALDCAGLRPARARDRLRGHAGGGDRGDA